MSNYLNKIYYLTDNQYDTLINNNSIIVNGITHQYDSNALYITDTNLVTPSPSVNGTATEFITEISQDKYGKISANKASLNTSGTWSGTIITTEDTSNALYPVGVTSSATTTLKRDTSIIMKDGKLQINGTNDNFNLYVNGKTQLNIGTSDGTTYKNFIIYGNNRFLSIGSQGIQSYSGAITSTTTNTLYLQYAGGSLSIGENTPLTSTIYKATTATINWTNATMTGSYDFSTASGLKYSGMQAGTANQARIVWFADNTNKGIPVYDNNFKYNPSNSVLTLGKLTVTGGSTDSSISAAGKMTISSASNQVTEINSGYTLYLSSATNTSIIFTKGGGTTNEIARFDINSNFVPKSGLNNTIGTSTNKWNTIYATNITTDNLTGSPTIETTPSNGDNSHKIADTAFVHNTLKYVNSMQFKGTIGTGGTITALPTTYNAGDTYRVITAGTYAGKYCEVGTLIMCVNDNEDSAAAVDTDWTSVETNEDGSVIGPSSSTANQIPVFSSNTGRVITNSNMTYSNNKLNIPVNNTSVSEGFCITRSAESNVTARTIMFTIGTETSNANAGLYDSSNTKWIVYSNKNGEVYLNGNAMNANYLKLYETRETTTTLNKAASYVASGAMFHLIASSSTSTADNGKTPTDANILQMNWDTDSGYDAQLGISTAVNRMFFRNQPSTKKEWQEVAHATVSSNNTGSNVKPVYMTSSGVITPTTNEMIQGFLKSTTSSAHVDLNTLYDSGFYSIPGGYIDNIPTGSSVYATIITAAYRKPSGNTKPDYAWQMGNFTQNNDRLWYRTSQANTWRAWRQIVNIATNTAVGNETTPVYIDANGEVQTCTSYANASVATATNLATKPSFTASGNDITVTAGGKTSDAFTVPYATTTKALANINGTYGTAVSVNTTTDRVTDANIAHLANGGIIHFKIVSAANGPTATASNNSGNILHFHWDAGAWDSQLFVPHSTINSMAYRASSAAGTWGNWRALLDSSNYTSYAYALDGSNTGTKLQISTQSAAYTNGIQFMNNTTKKGSIGTDNNGVAGIYGSSKVVLRPQLDASTIGLEVTTTAVYPTATMTLGTTTNKWSTVYATTFDGKATQLTDISSSDAATSTATWRHIWFSYDDNVTGRPAHTDNFAYQTSTNTLKTTQQLIGNSVLIQYNSNDQSLDFIFV